MVVSLKWPGIRIQAIFFSLIFLIPATAQYGHDLQLGRDLSIGSTGLGTFILGRYIIKEKPLDTLVIYDRSDIPGIDRIALDRWSVGAHTTSDILMTGSVAAAVAISVIAGKGEEPFIPVTIIAESLLLTSGITSIVKHSVARPRPFVYEVDVPRSERPANGGLVSFWSGHTSTVSSTTFACAALVQRTDATGTLKTATWIGAAVLPAAVGFFRIKAGRHFPTDVFTGYVFGALIGTAIPYFHRIE